MRRPSLTTSISIGLLAGLALGLVAAAAGDGALRHFTRGIEPAGTVWINLLRMCVIPLVVTAIVSGVGSLGDPRRLGRVGLRTFAIVLPTLLLAAGIGLGLSLLLVRAAPVAPETALALRETAVQQGGDVVQRAAEVKGVREFLVDLVPANPVRAAAEGSLLSLTVFAVLFGAAVGTLADEPRRAILAVTDAVLGALIRVIGWGMMLAPVGVFCLVAAVTARLGWETLRSLAVFVLSVVLAVGLFALLVYPLLTRWLVRRPVLPFARAIAPGATVAFTTASSMAALPTMMETALRDLGMSKAVASFVLPLAATLNRPGSALYQATAVVFVGSLYGVPLGPAQIGAALATSLLMTFSVAAMPSATVFTTAPVLAAAGLPVESLALLLGVDRIPDMFRTGLNGIGHQVVAAAVARSEGEALA
jgi:Na+/H+-dicarboxylate symporter